MIVYVESNFVLELALSQEQSPACEMLMQLCANKNIELCLPAYSLMEPYETLVRRQKSRHMLYQQLDRELQQQRRSIHLEPELNTLVDHSRHVLIDSAQRESAMFAEVSKKLREIATIIPLDVDILNTAENLKKEHGLLLPDAVVLASIEHVMEITSPVEKIFLNRNSKDFSDPDIKNKLEKFNCRLFFNFAHGVEYVLAKRPRN